MDPYSNPVSHSLGLLGLCWMVVSFHPFQLSLFPLFFFSSFPLFFDLVSPSFCLPFYYGVISTIAWQLDHVYEFLSLRHRQWLLSSFVSCVKFFLRFLWSLDQSTRMKSSSSRQLCSNQWRSLQPQKKATKTVPGTSTMGTATHTVRRAQPEAILLPSRYQQARPDAPANVAAPLLPEPRQY